MNELETKLNDVLQIFNKTFSLNIENDNEIVTKITISELVNDGSEFIEQFVGLFGPLVQTVSDGKKEIVFEEETGLVIKNIE